MATDLDNFIALSHVLTGERRLDPQRASRYLARLQGVYTQEMASLLQAFATTAAAPNLVFEVKRRIVEAPPPNQLPLVQNVIRCWFTSEFVNKDGTANTGPEEDYLAGLLWPVVEAHPPTSSKRTYGYWAKRP